MAFDLSNVDWTGLLNAGVNLYSSHQNANANQAAANQYAQQTKYNPYNISAGNSGVVFNGNNAAASLSPQYQQLQQQLTSGAGGLLGGLGQQYGQNGGVNPYLQSQFDQYNGQTMGSNASSLQPYGNLGPQLSSNVGDQFNATAGGFLGGLGSFDPNQAAQSYSQNLRAQAAPGNQLAAENTAQGLFNSGRLGSTGGANVLGQLTQAQNQQDLGFQIAGQQYGGQEQNRLAGLAQSFGQAGTGINNQMAQTNDQMTNSAFNRASTINQMQYNQVNQRADARFQNAMQLFGAGQQGLQNQLQGGLGMLQGSQGLDQNLLNTIGMGGYLGGASSNANSNAYSQPLQAQLAGNNSKSAGLLNALGSSGAIGGAANWLNGLFGGGKGVSDALGSAGGALDSWNTMPDISNGLQGMNMSNNDMWNGSGNLSQIFSGAGGQAANGISNGIQDLDYSKQIGGLAQPVPFQSQAGLLSDAGSAFGVYNGIKKGGVAGYAGALSSAGKLAGQAGLLDTGVASAGESAAGGFGAGGASSGGGLSGLVGAYNAIKGLGTKQGKMAGTANMAAAGMQIAGPWGALVGAIVGYAKEGGAKDTVPFDAAGMSGTTMDKAWQDQNLARLASNPAAAAASKLGVNSNSVLGKILDPSALFSKHGDEKRNMKAFLGAFPGVADAKGGYALPDGKQVSKDQLQKLAGAWYGATYHPDGDQEKWQKTFMQRLGEIYGG